MMCDGCKILADKSRYRRKYTNGQNRWLRHTNKKEPHCDYPHSCTCQHERSKL